MILVVLMLKWEEEILAVKVVLSSATLILTRYSKCFLVVQEQAAAATVEMTIFLHPLWAKELVEEVCPTWEEWAKVAQLDKKEQVDLVVCNLQVLEDKDFPLSSHKPQVIQVGDKENLANPNQNLLVSEYDCGD
jgi:hypothetical protein